MELTNEKKVAIGRGLEEYIATYTSQNKAAASLDVSAATLISIKKGAFENISDEMWRKIASRIGGQISVDGDSQMVMTSAVKDLLLCMDDTRAMKEFIWAISPAGSGKTMAAKHIRRKPNTYYVMCDESMKRREFAVEFARACGLKVRESENSRSIIMGVVEYLRGVKDVLIIFDEADKLNDNIVNYFISIFNYFEDLQGEQTVGVLFISTDYIERRMRFGLQYNKKGYQELWSRLGAKFYKVDRNSSYDVEQICRSRGVVAQRDINKIIAEADSSGVDLRRVCRKIKATLRRNQQQA